MSDEHAAHGDAHYIRIWQILLVLLLISFVGPMAEIQWLTLITAFGLRPWRPAHLLWGLLLPVLPLVALIDGTVSNLRSYSREELEELANSIDAPDFVWQIGSLPMARSKLEATYLVGWRRSRAEEVAAQAAGTESHSTIEPTSPPS